MIRRSTRWACLLTAAFASGNAALGQVGQKNLQGPVETVDGDANTFTFLDRASGKMVTLRVPPGTAASRLAPTRVPITVGDLVPGDNVIVRLDPATSPPTIVGIRVTTARPDQPTAATKPARAATPRRVEVPAAAALDTSRYTPLRFRRPALNAAQWPWHEERSHRAVVEVPPTDLGGRSRDEGPAMLALSAEDGRRIDAASIRIVRVDPATGEAKPAPSAEGTPYRWYDDAIPWDFPHAMTPISRTDNVPRVTTSPGLGHNLLATGEWRSGRVVFPHVQEGTAPSYYAVYYDHLPAGANITEPAPRGWVGDGSIRCAVGMTEGATFSTSHIRIDLADMNGDGLLDLLTGDHQGMIFYLPNVGTAQEPAFSIIKLLFDADGQPIDVGQHAAPKVYDFDGDGALDLLVGTYVNRVAWYRNEATDGSFALRFAGVLEMDGAPLELPAKPLVAGDEKIFDHDYYPVLEFADVDGDGRDEMLAGGYVTGRIFVYKLGERQADGTPTLTLAGPLMSGDEPINVRNWCAAPCLADLDGDGQKELLTGRHPYTAVASTEDTTLLYFVPDPQRPGQFIERPFPSAGPLPKSSLATPRVADLNADGLPDLAFSTGNSIYVLMNVGTRTEPLFEPAPALRLPHGAMPLRGWDFLDYDGDGVLDLVNNYIVQRGVEGGYPVAFERGVSVLPAGVTIRHDSNIGDDWFWPRLADIDGDGDWDILFGDWFGQVWLHEKRDDGYDLEGFTLATTDDQPIKVGPLNADGSEDFITLQGARTVFAVADFDEDGRQDLVVGDTFGKVYLYRRVDDGADGRPRFAPRVELTDVGRRLLIDVTDYDGDGHMDVICGGASGRVHILLGRGDGTFAEPIIPTLPPIEQPRLVGRDLNGDGDVDFFSPSIKGSVWVERSWVERGYAPAKAVEVQTR
jgi:hypothetical protein